MVKFSGELNFCGSKTTSSSRHLEPFGFPQSCSTLFTFTGPGEGDLLRTPSLVEGPQFLRKEAGVDVYRVTLKHRPGKSLGLRICGGCDTSSLPFGGDSPGVFICRVSSLSWFDVHYYFGWIFPSLKLGKWICFRFSFLCPLHFHHLWSDWCWLFRYLVSNFFQCFDSGEWVNKSCYITPEKIDTHVDYRLGLADDSPATLFRKLALSGIWTLVS